MKHRYSDIIFMLERVFIRVKRSTFSRYLRNLIFVPTKYVRWGYCSGVTREGEEDGIGASASGVDVASRFSVVTSASLFLTMLRTAQVIAPHVHDMAMMYKTKPLEISYPITALPERKSRSE